MSVKSYLDLEGLQRYDANWLLKFEAMALNDDDLEDIWDEAFPQSWSFIVNTEATGTGEKKTGIPFNLYGQDNIELTVDWGDGTTSTLISSNYATNNSEASVHEYSNAGEYTVMIISNKWKNTYLHSQYTSNAPSSANNSEVNLYWFKRTLVSIDSKLPKFNGCYFGTSSTALESQSNVSVNQLFSRCENLTDIPSDLFDNNPQLTQFQWCFFNCTSLQSIPSGLFDKNINAVNFSYCFFWCSSLTNIPSRLFDNNTQVSTFSGCFSSCTSISSIPSGLFDKNTAATNFSSCFVGVNISSIPSGLFDKNTAATNFSSCFSACSSLQSIPSGLFDNNTAVTNFSSCFNGCTSLKNFKLIIDSPLVSNFSSFVSTASNVTRIVCVPENSTTYTTLSSYAQVGDNTNNITISTTNINCVQTLEYTVDTDATTTNAKIATIPLAAVQNASSKLIIDWGDGNSVKLTPENITAANLTHTYSTAGNYQITVGAANWLDYQFLTDSNASSSNTLIQTFRNTVVSIDSSIPLISNSTLDYFFYNCTYLESYTGHIFDNLTNATSAVSTFKGCSSLAVISAATLRNQTQLTNATSMFEGCSTATYIPSGLISQCRQLTNATQMFKNCTSITYYPNTLLINNSALTTRTNMFAGCSNTNPTFYTKAQLESNGYYVELHDTEAHRDNVDNVDKIGIPFNLYYNLTAITLNVDWGNGDTSTLTPSDYSSDRLNNSASIHQYSNIGLYFVSINSSNWASAYVYVYYDIGYSDITLFESQFENYSLFYRQKNLIEVATKLPQVRGIVGGSTGKTNNELGEVYINCLNLKSIPSDLFDSNTAVISFQSCFNGCSSLASIPSGLFNSNTAATNFYRCFENCISIQSIPAGLFDKAPTAPRFISCFYGCTSLQSIPAGLFDKNTAVTDFSWCFSNCTSLTSIPAGLFDKNTAVTDFAVCFSDCTSLTSIPAGLFDKNTAVTDFSYCFRGCTSLTSVPSGLFDKNTAVTDFASCFNRCSSLTSIPAGLFDKNTAATDFAYCFYGCTSLQSIPAGLFDKNTAATDIHGCFSDCSVLTDFTVNVRSANVTDAADFVTKKTGVTRIVKVPSGSTTQTTFNSVASSLGLTIQTL